MPQVTGSTAPASISGPTGTANATAIAENVAPGAILFNATTTSVAAVTYSLTDNAGGKGTINSTNGNVTLSKDYETTSSLKATAKTGAIGTAIITLPITDVNKAPAFSSATKNACINDNSAAGTTLGTYIATDPDTRNAITYSIASGKTNTDFAVAGTTGVITVATGKTISNSTTTTYALVVKATDNAATLFTGSTTVFVTVGGCSGTGALTALLTLMSVAMIATQLL